MMTSCNLKFSGLHLLVPSRIYSNAGNLPLISLLGEGYHRVLDIGCGAGDNAALLKSRQPDCQVYGITHSRAEADLARQHMEHCWVFNIEKDIPCELSDQMFEAMIFSHVLEHLRDPAKVIARFTALLRKGGIILIAVPNVLSWRTRFQFLIGRFEYESAGALDDTHLRFFTYHTADKFLLAKSPGLEVIHKAAQGGVPLWLLRRFVFPKKWCEWIDAWGCRHWPNLFGGQVLLKVTKQ